MKKMKNTRNLKKADESIDYVGEFLGHVRDGPLMVIAGNERPEMKLNEGQTFIASRFLRRKCVKIMESIGKHSETCRYRCGRGLNGLSLNQPADVLCR